METVVALIIVGAVLLVLETILPGLIAGIIGSVCLVLAIYLGYARYGTRTGSTILLIVAFGLLLGTAVWVKYFPESRMAKLFVSKRAIGDLGVEKPDLIDQTGIAHSNLRPSGMATINGHRIDVITEGNMIERGTPVKVVAVEGAKVIVRAV